MTAHHLRARFSTWMVGIAFVLCGVGTAHAATIDFDSLGQAGGGFILVGSPYAEDGFRLTAAGGFFRMWRDAHPYYPGSPAFTSPTPNDTITLTEIGGATFNILSIDLSEAVNLGGQNVSVTFVGTRADTSTVNQTFNLDGSFGPETFAFTGFTNLVSVSWVQSPDYHQFDNVVVAPEPGTLALFAIGALGLAAFPRRQLRS